MRWPLAKLLHLLLPLLAGWLWLSPTPAAAQYCIPSAGNLSFGTIYTANNVAYTTSTSISVSCNGYPANSTVRICPYVSASDAGGPTGGPRQMASGANLLAFDAYQNSGNTTRFPNGDPDATTIGYLVTISPSGQGFSAFTVYGKVPAGQQSVATGSYIANMNVGSYYGPSSSYATCSASMGQSSVVTSFQATATNQTNCSVSTTAVNFGTVTGLKNNVDATGAVIVTCSSGAPYTVALDGGANGGTSATTRQMANGSNRVNYGLFIDNARSQGWYNATGTLASGTGNGSAQNIVVYGRVAPQTVPAPGSYSDSVIVTLTY